jgi:hypothetical protein
VVSIRLSLFYATLFAIWADAAGIQVREARLSRKKNRIKPSLFLPSGPMQLGSRYGKHGCPVKKIELSLDISLSHNYIIIRNKPKEDYYAKLVQKYIVGKP